MSASSVIAHTVRPRPFCPVLRTVWMKLCIDACWDVFVGNWASAWDAIDPDFQKDERARRFDHLDADLCGGGGGGNFDGAGTGGQD